MIRITSKHDGFRRAGFAHPAAATEYADGHFTPEQLQALKDEPMLIVEAVEGEPATTEEHDADLAEAMCTVFAKLGEGDFKGDGVPLVASVEKALGKDVTAAQVAEAWAQYQAAKE